MINLNALIAYKQLESLTYDTVLLEQPVPDIVDFDWKKILLPHPSNTDNTTIKELNIISKKTQNRTRQDVEKIHIIDQDLDYYFIELLKSYNIKYPQKIIDDFYSIIRPILLNIKMIHNRPRPAQLAPFYNIDINVIVTDTHHTASYPSGHTVYSSLVSNILKDMYPKISKKLLDNIVDDTADARVSQGVHFPSDNNASVKLVQYMYNKLKEKIL